MTRHKAETERRDRRIASYVTKADEEALRTLSTGHGYTGTADVIRHALALLVEIKHPNIKKELDAAL